MEELKLIEKQYGKIELEFVGLVSNICVFSNVIMAKAYFPESEIKVDSSCCAGTSIEAHKQAMNMMASCHIHII